MPISPITLNGCPFKFVARINEHIEKTSNCLIFGYNPKNEYKNVKGLPLNKYGDKTFCNFNIPDLPSGSGVYALIIDENIEKPVYIGRASNLKSRWSETNYAHISPRNCYKGGQSTNCHINGLIYDYISKGHYVDLYVYKTTEYKETESTLIDKYKPEHNIQIKIKTKK